MLSLASNLLSGTVPDIHATDLAFLDLSSNSFNGTLPMQLFQLPNLTYLDLSYNAFVGSLPPDLPPSLAVLNLTSNKLNSSLPQDWGSSSSMAMLRLDNNPLTGALPEQWANLGQRTGNSLQLSLVSCSLLGRIPKPWVEQFCLQVARSSDAQVLYQPPVVQLTSSQGNVEVSLGSSVVLETQHASINFTLGDKPVFFTYQDTKSVCSIPYAISNAAIVWAVFGVILLSGLFSVYVWAHLDSQFLLALHSRKAIVKVKAVCRHGAVQIVMNVLSIVGFLLFDVAIFLYSQVSDFQVVHQVLNSQQRLYGYVLLSLLVLPYALLIIVLACVCIHWGYDSCLRPSWPLKIAYTLYGLLLTPVMFIAMEVGIVLHGLGIPISESLRSQFPDMSAYYRLNAAAESLFNALPQAILQTKLYLMGNTSKGTGQYIDTWLFLYSVIASLLSVLKTAVKCFSEGSSSNCAAFVYLMKLVTLQPLKT